MPASPPAPEPPAPADGTSASATTAEVAPGAAAKAEAKAPTPTEIGRFLVLRLLGAGGMGMVFLAYDPELDRKVAVKLLHPEVSGSAREPVARARLAREAKALARLSHPNVVAIYDVGAYGDQIFIAMEYIAGTPLRAWFRDHPWRPGGRSERRRRRQLLEIFLAAGHGLAAAHRQGLVHGDLKPDNILVGADGRTRVVDFGLASSGDDTTPEDPPPRGHDPLDLRTHLTASGAIAGTPAYLPPERLRGDRGSPAADQYSFCVSLYEGLYDQRPFGGANLPELRAAVARGLPPEPRDRPQPAWLRRILQRGLSRDPGARFPDMDTLLVALAADPARRRLRLLTALGLLLLLLSAALVYRGVLLRDLERRQGLCSGAADQLRGVWDPERRLETRRAFLATGLPYAADTWSRVESRLDSYAHEWSEQFTALCRATHLRGEQSPALLDLRLACMRRRLAEARALVDLLGDAGPETVENAVQAASALPDLRRCLADAESLREPPAHRKASPEALTALHQQLDRAAVLEQLARFHASLNLAEEAMDTAERLGDRPALALAARIRSTSLEGLGEPASEGALHDAFTAALATEDPGIQARAALALLYHYTERLDLAGAERWSRNARAILERSGLTGHAERSLESELHSLRGTLRLHTGDLDGAEADYRQAISLAQDNPSRLAGLRNNLGNLLVRRGDWEPAAAELEGAADLYREQFGPGHPLVAAALNNLAELASRRGAWEQADDAYQRARAIFLAVHGRAHPNVSVVDNNLGDLGLRRGDLKAAQGHYERAIAGFSAAFGDNAAPLAYPLTGLGEVTLAQGDPSAATALLERALALVDRGEPTAAARTRLALARALGPSDPRAPPLARAAHDAYAAAGPAYTEERALAAAWLQQHAAPPPE